ITTPELAVELIAAAKQGAPNLPVSVKTRVGYNKDVLDEWLPKLLSAKPAAVTVHARTRKEMSAVPARWERVARAVEIRNEVGSDALIIGNGDATSLADARAKVTASGADGAMLGRAIFGNPWLFATEKNASKKSSDLLASHGQTFSQHIFPSLPERLRVAVEHAKLFEELLGDIKNFALMKKHFKAYAEGFPGAKELRVRLMETNNAQEIETIIEDFLKAGVY
ncbi:MAG: tRNA-dihydrouridine synthase, partial [Candidatus Adlerbacteria bacterium]